jgi:hypothetical protein
MDERTWHRRIAVLADHAPPLIEWALVHAGPETLDGSELGGRRCLGDDDRAGNA